MRLLLFALFSMLASYGQTLAFSEIQIQSRPQVAERGVRVIRTATEWRVFLEQDVRNSGSAPPVNFSRDTVLAVFAGQRPTGGHRLRVDRITARDGVATVHAMVSGPPPGAMVTQVLTYPFVILKVRGKVSKATLELR